jgi:competence protein ComEC
MLLETPPLYIASFAVVAGDALGNCGLWMPLWCAALIALAAGALFLAAHPAFATATATIAIVAAATIPAHQMLAPPEGPTSLARFADGAIVTLEGRVVRAPEHAGGDRTYLYLRVDRAGVGDALAPAAGLIRLTQLGEQSIRLGDRLGLTSSIRFPRNDGNPGEFDYRGYLLRNGIVATMVAAQKKNAPPPITILGHRTVVPGSAIEAARDRIGALIDSTLHYPESAEMRALIIGDRGGIDEPLRQKFALTGMAHLLVISGLHLGFAAAAAFFAVRSIAGFFPALMVRGYANKLAAAGAALGASAYAAIAGNHVSTMRALVMVLAYTTAILLDRSREALASLALAALVICLCVPGSTADIGFQLSFASVAVILLGMRRFAAWWRHRHELTLRLQPERRRRLAIAEAIVGYVAVSFWALLGTAPLTAFHFNQFSIVGLIANAVVVPIMGFGAVVCGLVAAALSFVWRAPAAMLMIAAGKLATIGTALAGWFVMWPLAWSRIFTPTPIELAIAYCAIALWLSMPLAGSRASTPVNRVTRQSASASGFQNWRNLELMILTIALIFDAAWWIDQRYFNRDLRVTFLSVGEGDGAVIRFPGGRVMLIDAGGAFRGAFDPGERIVAPYLWANKIMRVDYLALSHPDRDHFGGFTFIARNFSPAQFWTGGTTSDDLSYGEMLDAIRTAGTRSYVCNSASAPMMLGGVSLRCVGPVANATELKENNSSMVIRLGFGGRSILFTGDLEAKGERELIAAGADLRATILKVPHHGSHTSSTAALIAAVDPQVAVISLGYRNRFHFPAREVLQRYLDAGVTLIRTDDDGAVSADLGRDSLRIWSFRGGPVRPSAAK